MTKISQSEYIKAILMKVRSQMQHIIYENMVKELGMLPDNHDTRRVSERLIDDSIFNLSNELYVYIEETGVPRKKRENKETDESSKKKSNAYVEFCKLHRKSVSEQMKKEMSNDENGGNVTLKASDVTKRLSEMWNALNV
jgi:hypothetical protein